MPAASCLQTEQYCAGEGGRGWKPQCRGGSPTPLPSRRLQLEGWAMEQPASPDRRIQYMGYCVLLNWTQHACPQNVQATAPGDQCSLLEPRPALHIEILINAVRYTGIVDSRRGMAGVAGACVKGLHFRASGFLTLLSAQYVE